MSNKVEATFHPHPSYTAMEAAWDPVRRAAKYPGTLASLLPKPDRPDDAWAKVSVKPENTAGFTPSWAGDLARQKRPRKK